MLPQIFSLLSRRVPKGYRVRNVFETFDQAWTNRYFFAFKEPQKTVMVEGIMHTLHPDEMGGIIVFSTDVNATVDDANPVVRWFKRQYQTWRNRFAHKKKIDKALGMVKPQDGENAIGGYSIGNFFKGRYKSETTGELFEERSLAVEVLFIKHRQLIELATTLCGLFNQQSVLVKDNASGKIHLVDRH